MRAFLVALALLVGAVGRAHGTDIVVAGAQAMVTEAKVVKLGTGLASGILPNAGSVQDPTLHGAEIRLFDVGDPLGFGAGELRHALPAGGWRGLGHPAGSAGYVYRGSDVGDTVCRKVKLTEHGVRALCKGAGVMLTPPFLADMGVVLGVPTAAPTAAIRYCAEFGGEERINSDMRLLRRDAPAPAACPEIRPAPNFIVIELDDTRFDGIDLMPIVQARLAGEGVSFSESFVPNAVCCPSRASLFTGLYSLHHGTRSVGGNLGGADTFRQSGADQQTIALWLQNAGYLTGLFGKYLNEYGVSEANQGPGGTFYLPPGWDRWRAQIGADTYGGIHGSTYEIIDESRQRTLYDDHGTDAQYGTDVLAQWVRELIADATAAGRPFFAYWAPYASHGDPIFPAPAARHYGSFEGLPPWRPPNWNEADVTDKPRWVQLQAPGPLETAFTDVVRKRAYESLLAVDEQLGLILDQLDTLGIADHTVVLLTSDNGSSWGEHRLWVQLKEAPYEHVLRVPLIARYPRGGQAGVTVAAPVLNLDIAPSLLALADVPLPAPVDGLSFAAWLEGDAAPAPVRGDFMLEHFRWIRSHGVAYSAQPTDGDQYRLFHGDMLARPRPSILFEFDTDAAVSPGAVRVAIGGDADATFAALAAAVVAQLAYTQPLHNTSTNVVTVIDPTPPFNGVFWREERDQAGVMSEFGAASLPDYVGVRDVAGGFTYVEYESNEVELYDLDADPWQLQNKAADPAYAGERTRLSERLRELLAETP